MSRRSGMRSRFPASPSSAHHGQWSQDHRLHDAGVGLDLPQQPARGCNAESGEREGPRSLQEIEIACVFRCDDNAPQHGCGAFLPIQTAVARFSKMEQAERPEKETQCEGDNAAKAGRQGTRAGRTMRSPDHLKMAIIEFWLRNGIDKEQGGYLVNIDRNGRLSCRRQQVHRHADPDHLGNFRLLLLLSLRQNSCGGEAGSGFFHPAFLGREERRMVLEDGEKRIAVDTAKVVYGQSFAI